MYERRAWETGALFASTLSTVHSARNFALFSLRKSALSFDTWFSYRFLEDFQDATLTGQVPSLGSLPNQATLIRPHCGL